MSTDKKTECPMHSVMAALGGKWKFAILYCLNDGKPMRFKELQRTVAGITARMLTKELKSLQDHQLISRKVYPEVPPRVEYQLTKHGKSLIPMINELDDWGREHSKRMRKK